MRFLGPANRRGFLAAATALPWTLLEACRRTASSTKFRELKVAFVPRITVGGIYAAEEEGFFRDARLTVRKVIQRRNEFITPLLTAGTVDVGFVQMNPSFVNAVASGARARIVAGRDVASGSCGSVGTLYGTRNKFPDGFRDLRVLRHKRIAVSSKSINLEAFSLEAILASAGMSTADIELVQLEQAQSVAALIEGKIDAMVMNFLDSYAEGLSPDIVRGPGLADLFPGMQYNFVAFGPSLLDGDPQIGAAFLSAFFRGVRAFVSGKYSDRLVHTLAEELSMEPKLVGQSCRSGSVLDGRIDPPSIQRMVDWSVRKGFTKKPPAVSDIVDTRFVELLKTMRWTS